MHEFILQLFKFFKSFLHFMKIVCTLCILTLLLYWIQNLTNASWTWLEFAKPFLDSLLEFTNSIYSISFNLWGAVFELKYLSAVVILVLCFIAINLLMILTGFLEGVYRSTHFICKKAEEVCINKSLKDDVRASEKKICRYTVTIHNRLKAKFSHPEINVDIEEQNKIMTDFIYEKLNVKPKTFEGGFMYSFKNYETIDNVLDVLFKIIHSNTPMEQAICIQSGDLTKDLEAQLKKLISLNNFGKITMASDTSYRYRFNDTHRYQTSQMGIFQYESAEKTLEVHEFKEFL